MPGLPTCFATVVLGFAPALFQRSWRHAEVLLTGTILAPGAPGKRTVSSLLRISGLAQERRFVTYHRVLNHAALKSSGGIAPSAGPTGQSLRAGRAGGAGH